MANYRNAQETEQLKMRVMLAAARLFLTKGYGASTTMEIAEMSGIHKSTLMYVFKCKDEVLAELVAYVLEWQFMTVQELLADKTDDPILFYAAETTLQLYMAESSEQIRDLYEAAYSLPRTSAFIQQTITGKLKDIFKSYLPHLETKDFYELEIASGGIIRGFMTVPCNMYFTMERKVQRFLETTFKIYDVPREKTQEAIQFVSQFDFAAIAKQTINALLQFLEEQIA